MNKRGQGLSLNTIIIAAIVILVLIVLILIFTGRMAVFTGEVQSCARARGECKDTCELGIEYEVKGTDCGEEFYCCVDILDTDGTECVAKSGTCTDADLLLNTSVSIGRIDCEQGQLCAVTI